jgi:hypothetical protein
VKIWVFTVPSQVQHPKSFQITAAATKISTTVISATFCFLMFLALQSHNNLYVQPNNYYVGFLNPMFLGFSAPCVGLLSPPAFFFVAAAKQLCYDVKLEFNLSLASSPHMYFVCQPCRCR